MYYLVLALLNGFLVALVTGFILSPDRAKKLPGGSMMVAGMIAYSAHQSGALIAGCVLLGLIGFLVYGIVVPGRKVNKYSLPKTQTRPKTTRLPQLTLPPRIASTVHKPILQGFNCERCGAHNQVEDPKTARCEYCRESVIKKK